MKILYSEVTVICINNDLVPRATKSRTWTWIIDFFSVDNKKLRYYLSSTEKFMSWPEYLYGMQPFEVYLSKHSPIGVVALESHWSKKSSTADTIYNGQWQHRQHKEKKKSLETEIGRKITIWVFRATRPGHSYERETLIERETRSIIEVEQNNAIRTNRI